MSQFSDSLGALSSRSNVTSAADAGIAIAAKPIDANATSLSVVNMQLLPLPIVIAVYPAIRTAKLRRRVRTWARPGSAFPRDRVQLAGRCTGPAAMLVEAWRLRQ